MCSCSSRAICALRINRMHKTRSLETRGRHGRRPGMRSDQHSSAVECASSHCGKQHTIVCTYMHSTEGKKAHRRRKKYQVPAWLARNKSNTLRVKSVMGL